MLHWRPSGKGEAGSAQLQATNQRNVFSGSISMLAGCAQRCELQVCCCSCCFCCFLSYHPECADAGEAVAAPIANACGCRAMHMTQCWQELQSISMPCQTL